MKQYLMIRKKGVLLLTLVMEAGKVAGTVGVAAILSMVIDTIYEAIEINDVTSFRRCLLLCFIYALAFGTIVWITERLKAYYIEKNTIEIRNVVFRGIVNKPLDEYYDKKEGEYLTLLNTSIGTWEENCLKNFFTIVEFCFSILMAAILLLKIHPMVMVLSIMAMSIPTLIPKLYSKKLANCQKNILEKTAIYTSAIKDHLQGMEVICAYNSKKEIVNKQECFSKDLEHSKKNMADTMAGLYGVSNFTSIFVQFSIMLLAGYFAVKGYVSIGNIIAITQLSGQVISPAFQLSAKITQLKSTKPVLEQLKEIYSSSFEEKKRIEARQKLEKEIKLEHLSFSYGQDMPNILDDISYTFEKGKKYALLGESGSGKSTLLKILANIHKNYKGKVIFDREENQERDITMIHQNIFLFDDSIKNNITLYQDFSEEEIQKVILAAGLQEVVKKLPEGIYTQVEENGKRFSGGEKQRIAIARALLHKKSVLLIDEATSSLDEKNTKMIEETILNLKDTTSITITHKLEKAMSLRYDKLLKLEKGKLVECSI